MTKPKTYQPKEAFYRSTIIGLSLGLMFVVILIVAGYRLPFALFMAAVGGSAAGVLQKWWCEEEATATLPEINRRRQWSLINQFTWPVFRKLTQWDRRRRRHHHHRNLTQAQAHDHLRRQRMNRHFRHKQGGGGKDPSP